MPEGPFVAIAPGTFPGGFDRVPPGGLCLSAFLFVTRPTGEVLLGRYDPAHPAWPGMTGLDEGRLRKYAEGWTVPASHLRWGEDPREAARRIGRTFLGLDGLRYGEPRVATETYELARLPGERHFDVLFLVEAQGAPARVEAPPWYAALAWHDPRALPAGAYARGHEDVVARWLALRDEDAGG